MKKVKIGLLITVIAITGALAYATQRAFAEGHGQCGANTAADCGHKHGTAAAAPAKAEAPAKGDEAVIAEQKDSYPLNTCVVLGNELGKMGAPYDYVYKGRLVRFCCKGCVSTFEKDPNKYLSKLDAAAKEKTKPAPEAKTDASSATDATGHAHRH